MAEVTTYLSKQMLRHCFLLLGALAVLSLAQLALYIDSFGIGLNTGEPSAPPTATEHAAESQREATQVDQDRKLLAYGLTGFTLLAIAASAAFVIRPLAAEIEKTTWELLEARQTAEHLAFHDALTGLPNRRYLTDHLERMLSRAERTQTRLGLLHIDLDRLKSINDQSGHDAGDEALCAASSAMKGVLRRSDFLARMGGDEFAAVVTEFGDTDGVGRLAVRVNEAVRRAALPRDDVALLSVSIGVAIAGDHLGYNANDLAKRADEALYTAKDAGRGGHRIDPKSLELKTSYPRPTRIAG